MGFTIAVAGKGGIGKTTLTGLIIKNLRRRGKVPILAVDADSNVNLAETIGLEGVKTVGAVRENFSSDFSKIPHGMNKDTFLELKLNQAMVEGKDVDILAMGRGEGPGCYCPVNNMLRRFLDVLTDNYPFVVIDNEAGMEHLSRRILQAIDVLLIVSDPTPKGIRTAGRIKDLVKDLQLSIKDSYLVINRIQGELETAIQVEMEKKGFDSFYRIPMDSLISEYDLAQKPLTDLPEESIAVNAVDTILSKIL
ncbi:MAG: AAA family ATPase [Thermodesulfobacteriota bacterium]|nr:AAA family ATPase [Thermodesulfobacteriota bacterium]